MADEPVVEETPVVEPVVETEVVEIHPLEPGGKRFQEVYGDWRSEQQRAQRAEAEIAALRQQMQPRQPQQYTPEQIAAYLQQQIDQGQITPMAAANALSQFNARQVATQTAMQVEQIRTQGAKLQAAGTEVNQYIARVPSLKDTNSDEFKRVSEAAYSASDDMGLPVTDLRVQRRALREVYGTLDKMAKNDGERESSRRASLPHVETSAGGTRQPAAPAGADAWKKDVPADYLTYWKQRGYSEQQMKDEAKYVTKAPRKVRSA
mgnify:CR=1 FL=1